MKFLVINGPNLNMLGLREPSIYGDRSYKALVELIETVCRDEGIAVEVFQSNHEGAIVDKIQGAYGNTDGIVINPAAYTHTSVAIADAVKGVGIPTVEVHISEVSKREAFRQVSYIGAVAAHTITGRGLAGYTEAMDYLAKLLGEQK